MFGLCVIIFDCHIYYIDIDSLWAVGCIGFPAFLSQSAIRISIRFAIVVQAGHSVGIFISLLVFSIERLVVCFLAVLFRNIWLWSFISNARVQKQPLFCIYHTWYCYQSPFHWVRTWNCYLFTSKFKPLWWRVFLNFQWQTSALHQVFRGSIAFPFQFWVWGSYFSFLFLRFSVLSGYISTGWVFQIVSEWDMCSFPFGVCNYHSAVNHLSWHLPSWHHCQLSKVNQLPHVSQVACSKKVEGASSTCVQQGFECFGFQPACSKD